MWEQLRDAVKKVGEPGRFTRIETGDIVLGVSDIEYVTPKFHGWVESKVMAASRDTSTFMFKTPFKVEQMQWVLEHHNPKRYLVSWLLVGQPRSILQGVGWERWFLLPAPVTTRLLKTIRPTIGEVLQWPEVVVCSTAAEVIRRLGEGIKGTTK